jgi:hypothetical protein
LRGGKKLIVIGVSVGLSHSLIAESIPRHLILSMVIEIFSRSIVEYHIGLVETSDGKAFTLLPKRQRQLHREHFRPQKIALYFDSSFRIVVMPCG